MTDSFLDVIQDRPNPGRVERQDPRSLNYPARTDGVVRSVTHTPPPEKYRLDQGHLGSCTGNAGAQWLNSKPAHKARTAYLTEADAVAFYSRATRIDPWPGSYPPEDTGSSGLAVAKAMQEAGKIREYRWAFGLQHTLEALTEQPVMMGTTWYEDMFYPNSDGFVTPTGRESGGHEFLLFGLNTRAKYVWALNSWSALWGLKGRFKMSFATLDALLQQGADITVPIL